MTPTLKSRWPKFDFTKADMIWSQNPECSMVWNSMSTNAPVVEPWLNRVMIAARKKLAPDSHALKAEIDEFVRQESNHYRMHIEFNRQLETFGYKIPAAEDERFAAELRDLLKNRSLAFNAAYCAGFENYTLFTSKFMFEEAGDLFKAGDLAGADLWLWHMAEEYEHRSVCHDVFAAVSGNYFMRIYGLVYSFIHLSGHVNKRAKMFMNQYREGMGEAERKASVKREKAYNRRYMLYFVPRMLAILVPYYDPGKSKASPQLSAALSRFSSLSA
jgi:uncharacterized protein